MYPSSPWREATGGLSTMQALPELAHTSGLQCDFYLDLPLLLFGTQEGEEKPPLPVHTLLSFYKQGVWPDSSESATRPWKMSLPSSSYSAAVGPPTCTSAQPPPLLWEGLPLILCFRISAISWLHQKLEFVSHLLLLLVANFQE